MERLPRLACLLALVLALALALIPVCQTWFIQPGMPRPAMYQPSLPLLPRMQRLVLMELVDMLSLTSVRPNSLLTCRRQSQLKWPHQRP